MFADGGGGVDWYFNSLLGIPHRRMSRQVRFVLEEVMTWAKRWSQEMKTVGGDSLDPVTAHSTLRQAIATLAA